MWTTYHLVHCPHKDTSKCSGPVGGTDTGWLAEEVHDLDSQRCRPCGPATANHLNRHDAHDQVSRRRDASDAESQNPRTSKHIAYQLRYVTKGIPAKTRPVRGSAPSQRETEKETPSTEHADSHKKWVICRGNQSSTDEHQRSRRPRIDQRRRRWHLLENNPSSLPCQLLTPSGQVV